MVKDFSREPIDHGTNLLMKMMYIVFVNFVMLTQGSRGVYCQADLAQLITLPIVWALWA